MILRVDNPFGFWLTLDDCIINSLLIVYVNR